MHGLIAAAGGVLLIGTSLLCVVDDFRDREIAAHIVLFTVVLWTALFAAVLRGSIVTRLLAAVGLVSILASMCLGVLAAMFR